MLERKLHQMTELVFEMFFYYTLFHVLKLFFINPALYMLLTSSMKYPDAYLTSTEMSIDYLKLIDNLYGVLQLK